jgi:hypothetical protein
MPEKAYRRALVKKHVVLAKMMVREGLPAETVERELELIRLMWGHYRAISSQSLLPLIQPALKKMR